MENMLKFERLMEEAILPKRAHIDGDAAYDLFSPVHHIIPPTQDSGYLVKLGICMQLPKPPHGMDVYGQIHSRSGLALKKSVIAVGGVIDRNFTGEIGVILHNRSNQNFVIEKGDRIAQLVIHVIMTPEQVEVPRGTISRSTTERGSGGFGSSGN